MPSPEPSSTPVGLRALCLSCSVDTRAWTTALGRALQARHGVTVLVDVVDGDRKSPDLPHDATVVPVLSQFYVDHVWPRWAAAPTSAVPMIPLLRRPCALPPALAALDPLDCTAGDEAGPVADRLVARLGRWAAPEAAFHLLWRTQQDSAALLRTLARHTDFVSDVVLEPEERYAFSGGRDGAVLQWDLATGEAIRALTGHRGGVQALALATEPGALFSVGSDGTLRLWDWRSGRGQILSDQMDPTTHLCVVLDTGELALVARSSLITLFCPATGRRGGLTGHRDWVRTACPWPGGRLLSAGDDGALRLWDCATAQGLAEWPVRGSHINALARLPEGSGVLLGTDDRALCRWDFERGRDPILLGHHERSLRSVAVSRKGRWAVSGDAQGVAKVWDLAAGREAQSLLGHRGGIARVCMSRAGDLALTASTDHSLKVWRLAGDGRRAAGPIGEWVSPHLEQITALAPAADGVHLWAASDDGRLSVWDLSQRRLVGQRAETAPVTALAVGRENALYFATADGQIRRWNWQRGEEAEEVGRQRGAVLALAVSPDGLRLASATENWSIRLWNLADGAVLHTLAAHRAGIPALMFLPDGRLVSADEAGRVLIWDTDGGRLVGEWQAHETAVNGLAWISQGILTAGDDGTLVRWSSQGGQPRMTYRGHGDWVTGVAPGPVLDGREPAGPGETFVSMAEDGGIIWWAAESGRRLAELGLDVLPTALWVQGQDLFLGDVEGNLLWYRFPALSG